MKTSRRCFGGGGFPAVTGLVFACLSAGVVCHPPSRVLGAVTFGQLDTFQDGSTMGWSEGASPNPPEVVAAGGPGGDADGFLRNVSSGVGTAGSRLVMFNEAQWAGDYNAAGVTRVEASAANFGLTPLYLRVAVGSALGTQYGSTDAAVVPADRAWHRVSFDLTAAALTKLLGRETVADALSNVRTLRILSAEAQPAFVGDALDATVGLDDVRALRLPGDANFDGRVDSADFQAARRHLGSSGSWREGDFDFDGRTTARDLLLLRRNFGASLPPADVPAGASGATVGVVPEPAAALMLLTVPAFLLARRRRR